MALAPGLSAELRRKVDKQHTATHHGNPGVDVLGTPVVCEWVEEAACLAVHPHLDPGMVSVGTVVNIKHLAATPIGMTVRVHARLTEVDGRRLVFAVEAFDEKEKIAESQQERFIVTLQRFLERTAQKAKG
jgi:predicted thioesterase